MKIVLDVFSICVIFVMKLVKDNRGKDNWTMEVAIAIHLQTMRFSRFDMRINGIGILT